MMARKRRGRLHGAAMTVWFFFANMFDPIKAAKTEQLFTTLREDPRPGRHTPGAPPSR